MTELMKRYEKEFGAFPAHDAQWTSTHYTSWVHLQLLRAEQEIKQLKAQLTWRRVSEKPEKAGLYWCELLDNETGSVHYNPCQYVGGWLGRYQVIRYIPIPPAPEGERK